jgi:hypothetical protein
MSSSASCVLCFIPPHARLIIPQHKWLLSRASGFFKDMLSLKQPDQPDARVEDIVASEEGKTLEQLLRFIYPVPPPTISNLDELTAVLEAAIKYDIPVAIESLREMLSHSRFAEGSASGSLAVYAVATRYGFAAVASQALRQAISRPLLSIACPPAQLRQLTGEEYHRVIFCQRQRADLAREVVSNSDLRSGNLLGWMCDTCSVFGCSWWKTYKDAVGRLLADQPTSDILWTKNTIEQCLFRGCEKRYFHFARAVEVGYFDNLHRQVDALPWEFSQQ